MSYLRLASLIPLLATGCATPFMSWPPKADVTVVAHRGASAYAPENTIAAFQKAVELGAPWFELDCHLSKDGEVVVIHDNDVSRTTNGEGKVDELTVAELKALDAGAWFNKEFAGEPIPTLEEALLFAKKNKIGVYVEIKARQNADLISQLLVTAENTLATQQDLHDDLIQLALNADTDEVELTRKTIEVIKKTKMTKHVVIQSFSAVCCLVACAEAPEIPVAFLGSTDQNAPLTWEKFLHFGEAIGVDAFNIAKDGVTPEHVARFHQNKKTTAVWTVDKPQEMAQLVDLGVNGLITNRPDVALRVLKKTKK